MQFMILGESWIHDSENKNTTDKLTVVRTLIFTQSAGGPTSTTIISVLSKVGKNINQPLVITYETFINENFRQISNTTLCSRIQTRTE